MPAEGEPSVLLPPNTSQRPNTTAKPMISISGHHAPLLHLWSEVKVGPHSISGAVRGKKMLASE